MQTTLRCVIGSRISRGRPRWALHLIKKLAEHGSMIVTLSVTDDLEGLAEFAEALVTEVILGLRLDDYSETVQLHLDIADVYGVHVELLDDQDQVVEEQGWYLNQPCATRRFS